MSLKKISLTVASVAAAAVVGAGALLTSSSAWAATSTPSANAASTGMGDQHRHGMHDGFGPAAPNHTEITGDLAAKVSAAVTAQVQGVTVESVHQDADGSYDVCGTKDGTRAVYEVSADLTTVTLKDRPADGMGGRHGGRGGSADAVVTGDEAAKVAAAVTAQNPGVSVEMVRQDADGSFDVCGIQDGNRVMYDVSADLATVTVHTGPQGGPQGAGPAGARTTTANA